MKKQIVINCKVENLDKIEALNKELSVLNTLVDELHKKGIVIGTNHNIEIKGEDLVYLVERFKSRSKERIGLKD